MDDYFNYLCDNKDRRDEIQAEIGDGFNQIKLKLAEIKCECQNSFNYFDNLDKDFEKNLSKYRFDKNKLHSFSTNLENKLMKELSLSKFDNKLVYQTNKKIENLEYFKLNHDSLKEYQITNTTKSRPSDKSKFIAIDLFSNFKKNFANMFLKFYRANQIMPKLKIIILKNKVLNTLFKKVSNFLLRKFVHKILTKLIKIQQLFKFTILKTTLFKHYKLSQQITKLKLHFHMRQIKHQVRQQKVKVASYKHRQTFLLNNIYSISQRGFQTIQKSGEYTSSFAAQLYYQLKLKTRLFIKLLKLFKKK